MDTIVNGNAGHLDTGIFGTRYLMDALAGIGRADLAMTVLNQGTYPGYGFEIGKGATTDWEEWTYASSMESHDHAMFGGINASFDSQLAGIQATGPGYSTISIAPQIPAGLQSVAASIDTVRGTVASSWSVNGNQVTMNVTVPVGGTASVRVPSFGQGSATTVSPAGGAVRQASSGTSSTYTVGSGSWQFTGSLVPASSTVLPGTWSQCAVETGTCSFAGTETVAFGAQGKYDYATVTGGTACSNTVFGDPDQGVSKACYIAPAPPTAGTWQQCATETGTCSFAGTETVAFGAQGKYDYATVTGGTDLQQHRLRRPGLRRAQDLRDRRPAARRDDLDALRRRNHHLHRRRHPRHRLRRRRPVRLPHRHRRHGLHRRAVRRPGSGAGEGLLFAVRRWAERDLWRCSGTRLLVSP